MCNSAPYTRNEKYMSQEVMGELTNAVVINMISYVKNYIMVTSMVNAITFSLSPIKLYNSIYIVGYYTTGVYLLKTGLKTQQRHISSLTRSCLSINLVVGYYIYM